MEKTLEYAARKRIFVPFRIFSKKLVGMLSMKASPIPMKKVEKADLKKLQMLITDRFMFPIST